MATPPSDKTHGIVDAQADKKKDEKEIETTAVEPKATPVMGVPAGKTKPTEITEEGMENKTE